MAIGTACRKARTPLLVARPLSPIPVDGELAAVLISLGCAENLTDSEIMAGQLPQAGTMRTMPAPEQADAPISTTGTFIARVEKRDSAQVGKILRLLVVGPGQARSGADVIATGGHDGDLVAGSVRQARPLRT